MGLCLPGAQRACDRVGLKIHADCDLQLNAHNGAVQASPPAPDPDHGTGQEKRREGVLWGRFGGFEVDRWGPYNKFHGRHLSASTRVT